MLLLSIMRLHFRNLCLSLSSVADFSNIGSKAPISTGRTIFFYPREKWGGLDMWFVCEPW